MNINDLDQNKTEQSIVNENIRLDTCRVTLERLKQEYDRVQNQSAMHNPLSSLLVGDLDISDIVIERKVLRFGKEHSLWNNNGSVPHPVVTYFT